MSDSHAQTRSGPPTQLPQQQQQPTSSVVNSRPTSSPRHKQKARSAALSAIATLPPSSNVSTSSPSMMTSPTLSPSASTSMTTSTPSPAVTPLRTSSTGTSPTRSAANSVSKQSSQPPSNGNHRAASGSLDRIAAHVQESGLPRGQDPPRSPAAGGSTSTTLAAGYLKRQTAQSSSSPESYPRKAPMSAVQIAPLPRVIVPSQPAIPVGSDAASLNKLSTQSSPRSQNGVIRQTKTPEASQQASPRTAQSPSTSAVLSSPHGRAAIVQHQGTNGAAQSSRQVINESASIALHNPQSKTSQPANVSSPRGYRPDQPLSRPLSHVLVTGTASQPQAFPATPSLKAGTKSTQTPQPSSGKVPLQSQSASPVVGSTSTSLAPSAQRATPSKSQEAAAQSAASSQNGLQSRLQASASSRVPAQPATTAKSEATVQAQAPSQHHSNGLAQKISAAAAAEGSSLPAEDRTTSATASEIDPVLSNHSRGSFLSSAEPIDYQSLLGEKRKFTPVSVASCLALSEEEMDNLIVQHVEEQGLPLVISDLHKSAAWPSDLFSLEKYQQLAPDRGSKGEEIGARNLTDGKIQSITVPDFFARCNEVKEYPPDRAEKLYGDELPCPSAWRLALSDVAHSRLQHHGEQDVSSSLSPNARSVTLACRFGPGRTCLPLHRDLCSSLGQDLMVWSDPGASSIWMIADPEDAEAVDQYITSKGGDPQAEDFAPHPKELVAAPFDMFCHQQRVGDLVLVPSRAPYMMINVGGRTMKTSWSRMTTDTLSSALFADLPLYQRYCRQEKLHVKSVIEETLIKYTRQIESHADTALESMPNIIRDLRKLLKMYDAILADEYVPEWRDIVKEGGDDSYVECDFCGADVLHGYFECPAGETLCTLCYCEGRLCGCADAVQSLKPRQHWRDFGERLQLRNEAAQILLRVKPELALASQPAMNNSDDDEDDEPPPWPVKVMKEEDIEKQDWPFAYMAAFKLYNIRQTPDWQDNLGTCRLCKAVLNITQRHYCKPCRHSYCHGCLLHKLKIHPVHTLAQKDPGAFHEYHRKNSALDYKEWQHNPLEYRVEAQAHFALLEAARTKMECKPISKTCRIGFLDVTSEHPYGLSGKLGLKNPRKNASEKAKVPVTPTSVSATSTPVSRKRQSDVLQAPSSPSPRDLTGKRARLDSSPVAEPMEEDSIALLTPPSQSDSSVRLDAVPARSSVSTPRTGRDRAITSSTPACYGATVSVPTVESGIRKFVLRAGKAIPVSPASPTASAASSVTSQSSPVVPAAPSPDGSPAKPSAQTSTKTPQTTSQPQSGTARVVDKSLASASPSSSAPIAAREQVASSSPTNATTSPAPVTTNGAPVLATPSRASAATAPASAQPATIAPAATVARSTQNAPTPVTRANGQGNAGAELLAAAKSAVAAGVQNGSARPVIATVEVAGPGTALAGVDTTNLRVIAEVLRLFSQSNQTSLMAVAEENRKAQAQQAGAQAAQADELKQMRKLLQAQSKELKEMRETLKETREQLAARDEMLKVSEAKQTGAMSHISRKLDVAMQQMHSKDERIEEKVEQVHEMFRGLMEDIERGARAQLEGEEPVQAADANVFNS